MLTANQTLSSDTLLPEHLLQALGGALVRIAVSEEQNYLLLRDVGVALYHLRHGNPAPYDPGELISGLLDVLQDYAPDGYYVGFHPGDGALLGVWAYEEPGI